MRRSLLIAILMWFAFASNGQTTCGNSDFESGNFNGWNGYYGNCCPINITNSGIIMGRHTIMTGAGVDPYSLGKIPIVAPGGSYSARIGNDDAGAEAERVSYQFTVSAANALFIYQYALVLEDPQHSAQHQPRFEVKMFDQNNSIIPCATYNVSAASNLPGFFDNGKVRLKEWSSVGIDLTAYIGQTVTIEFSVSDCGLGAHFGYAYIDCTCGSMNISSDFCASASQVQLTAPPGFTYLWSNGSTNQSIDVLNPVQGMNYSVTLTSVTGCQVTLNHFLEPVKVNASFSNSGCSNDVQFNSTASTGSGVIAKWYWEFGDGTTSNLASPGHHYSNPGNYSVKLKIENTLGCIDSIVKKITVYEGPLAEFEDYSSCYYKPVSFKDKSTTDQGIINSWKWYYGDSSATSHVQFPSHKYASDGNYRVSLVVSSSLGCTDSVSRIVDVYEAPKAIFNADDICFGTPMQFSNNSTTFNGMQLFNNWDFGDNLGYSQLIEPVYNYTKPGNHPVSLIVAADHWCKDTLTKSVIVAPIPDPDFNVNAPCEGQDATFIDQTNLAFGTINTWAWDFGDGGLGSNTSSPLHTYSQAGTYSVRLRVTSDYNCRAMTEKTISVFDTPDSQFKIYPVSGCSPLDVKFRDFSTSTDGIIQSWEWKLNNSIVSTQQSFDKLILNSGAHDVSLQVTTDKGCIDTKDRKESVQVNPTVVAEFLVETSQLTTLAPFFQFTNNSVNADNFIWLVDDSIVSFDKDFQWYSYTAGTYTITLIGNNAWNCSDSISTKITIEEDFAYYIPNTFTPNGDGKNDSFYGSGVGVREMNMQIFNRWGAEIYSCTGKKCSWDGITNEKALIAQDGVYLYVIKVIDIFNEYHTFKGQVTLMQ